MDPSLSLLPKARFDAAAYWAKRYGTLDISRSGHIDLPIEYNAWLYRRKKDCLLGALRDTGFDAKTASILDIAFGTGVYVDMWKALGVKRLAGVDLSAAAANALRLRYPEYAFYERDLALPGLVEVTGGDFNLVTAIDILYHIVDDAAFPVALSNLAAATAPGGVLAIHDSFIEPNSRDFGYLKLRTFKQYADALEAAGFSVVSRQPTFFTAVQCQPFEPEWAFQLSEALWSRVTGPMIRRHPSATGRITGLVDLALGKILRRGPSFEMLICRRRAV